MARWLDRLRELVTREKRDADLERELRAHLDAEIEEQLEAGVAPEEAPYAARRALGNVALIQEDTRAAWGRRGLERFLQDLGYAVRTLRKSPGFTLVVVLSLALGIGANAAVFTLINAVLLRPLPVANPQELVVLGAERRGEWAMVSFPMYRDLRARQQVFTDILATAGETPYRITIPESDGRATELDNLRVSFVSANTFAILGVQPALGRFFTEEDDRDPHTSETSGSVVVLSHGFWEGQFGRDPRVLGRTIRIGRSTVRVIGVAPAGFHGEVAGSAPFGWVPLVPFSSNDNLENRRGTFTAYMARRKPGVSNQQAQAAMSALFRQLLASEGRVSERLDEFAITIEPGATGIDFGLRRSFAKPLLIVMAIVALVLLIACANVANLLLARAATRRGEIGVRLAIGCSRGRLISQLLTESLLLAALGTAAGAALAYWGSRALLAMVAFGPVPVLLDLAPDPRVFWFLTAVTLFTGFGFGMAPALQAARIELTSALKGARGGDAHRPSQRLSRTLVSGQVALSLLLLIGAGLLIRSLRNLHGLDWGFRAEHVLVFDLAHSPERRDPESLSEMARRVRERVRQVPGVESASLSGMLLFSRSDIGAPLKIRDYAPAAGEKVTARYNSVSSGYLETLGMTLLEGRSIRDSDGRSAPAIAVINQAMARRYFAGAGAVGRVIEIDTGRPDAAPRPIEIVGVVRNAKYNDLRADAKPMFYVPIEQLPRSLRSLEVRTRSPLGVLASPVRAALAEISRDIMVRRIVTLQDQVDQSLAAERLILRLSGFFGVLALLLACLGLYGVTAYSVAQRTGEIGLRMALGASQRGVLLLVMRETSRMVLAGIVVGIPLASASARLLASLLYGVSVTDLLSVAPATALLLAAAMLAAYLPARRASRVDPMAALRAE